jgi:tRNA (guanine-N7-)-methyltransferase
MDREQVLSRKPPFRDRLPEYFPHPDVNPYVEEHRGLANVVPASEAAGWRGRWHELYGRAAPLHLEIGSGNGFYLSGMCALHPGQDWLGLEIRFKRVVLAARKLEVRGLPNGRVTRYDATRLEDLFVPGSLAGIHINHPDPWPRGRQAWRRLIGPAFAQTAAGLLAPGGELRLKTDFAPHVGALLQAVEGLPFEVLGRCEDLRVDGAPWPDEVTTNYQRKFDERGVPVLAAWLRRTGSA